MSNFRSVTVFAPRKELPLGVRRVEDVPQGTFVRKVKPCLACNATGKQHDLPCVRCNGIKYEGQNKVYTRGHWAFNEKKYCLDDVEDISRQVTVKRGTLLLVGFTY